MLLSVVESMCYSDSQRRPAPQSAVSSVSPGVPRKTPSWDTSGTPRCTAVAAIQRIDVVLPLRERMSRSLASQEVDLRGQKRRARPDHLRAAAVGLGALESPSAPVPPADAEADLGERLERDDEASAGEEDGRAPPMVGWLAADRR